MGISCYFLLYYLSEWKYEQTIESRCPFGRKHASKCPFGGKQEGTLSLQNLPLSKLAVYAVDERRFGGRDAHPIGI